MSTCFVIQPFDGAKFDKRYVDVYKPAIEDAGLEAYRVDFDPNVSTPIESIEKGIRQATICLGDISTDNPNVWYELGFAFAAKRPIVMVCSEERSESPRILRRLQTLRRWSHEQEIKPFFTRDARTRCSDGARAPRGVPIPVGLH